MAATRYNIVYLFVIFALCVNHVGLALPTINSVSPLKPQELTGKRDEAPTPLQHKGDLTAATNKAMSAAVDQPLVVNTTPPTTPTISIKLHINNTEKLKRGLTNFMNHLNPAPYFVPQDTAKGASAGSQATIINDGGADAVIKGPNRLTRPLGSPLRWGR